MIFVLRVLVFTFAYVSSVRLFCFGGSQLVRLFLSGKRPIESDSCAFIIFNCNFRIHVFFCIIFFRVLGCSFSALLLFALRNKEQVFFHLLFHSLAFCTQHFPTGCSEAAPARVRLGCSEHMLTVCSQFSIRLDSRATRNTRTKIDFPTTFSQVSTPIVATNSCFLVFYT